MCQPSPVAQKAWSDDLAQFGPRVTYLGIVGDASHQARRSDHNCKQKGCSGEGCGFAKALDTGVGTDRDLAFTIIQARFRTRDELGRCPVKYCIYDGILYFPDGSTQRNTGHETHVHTSFEEWAWWMDYIDFYSLEGDMPLTQKDREDIGNIVEHTTRKVLNEGAAFGTSGNKAWAKSNTRMYASVQDTSNILNGKKKGGLISRILTAVKG